MRLDKTFCCPKNAHWKQIECLQVTDFPLTFSNYQGLRFIEISGTDAKKFLQGQLTCNIESLNEGTAQLAAVCTYQGRVIAVMCVYLVKNAYWLQLPEEIADDVLTYFKKYAQFSNVELRIVPVDKNSETDSRVTAIKAGIPFIYSATSEKFTPQMLNLDKLNAIDFKKGCYVGQEVIARTHYKGKSKRALFYSVFEGEEDVTPGIEILVDDEKIGVVVDGRKSDGKLYVLAVLFLAEPADQVGGRQYFLVNRSH